MKTRIAMWAGAGFLVAAGWAVFAYANAPFTNQRMQDVWVLISLTCPVAIAGKHFPIALPLVLVLNSLTYGVAGLLVETVRRLAIRPDHAKQYSR